jgi:hypothetical protein
MATSGRADPAETALVFQLVNLLEDCALGNTEKHSQLFVGNRIILTDQI